MRLDGSNFCLVTGLCWVERETFELDHGCDTRKRLENENYTRGASVGQVFC